MEGVLPTVLRVTPGEELHVGVTSTRNRDDFGRFIGGGVIDLAGDADRIGGFFREGVSVVFVEHDSGMAHGAFRRACVGGRFGGGGIAAGRVRIPAGCEVDQRRSIRRMRWENITSRWC